VSGRVLLTPEARADVVSIGRWYRDRSVRAAEEFLIALGLAFARIEAQPASNVVIDADSGTRRALLRRFPHRVLYLIEDGNIVVFAVMHHRRDAPAWRERLD
jgi:toxin ParE1/3/4